MGTTKESHEIVDAEKKSELRSTPYRSLDEFTDFQPISQIQQYGVYVNKIDKANENTPSRAPDEHYEGNSYHIALRNGEFSAQKDSAMAEVYKYFLGYGPEVDVIQSGEEFYIASRTIKNLHHRISDYGIDAKGNLFLKVQTPSQQSQALRLIGLAGTCALTYFFGESDVHYLNWGTQEMGGKLIAYKIDNANSLDLECLSSPITLEEIEALPKIDATMNETIQPNMLSIPEEIVSSEDFQKEKKAMFKKIAETDFSIIKNMLIKHITSNQADESLAFFKRFGSLVEKGTEYLSKTFNSPLEDCQRFVEGFQSALADTSGLKEVEDKNIQYILGLLEKRHITLRNLLGVEKSASYLPQFSTLPIPQKTQSPVPAQPQRTISQVVWHV